jgi:hypothetical protein
VRARGGAAGSSTHDSGHGRATNIYSTDSSGRGSSIVSDGNCTILSTPDGSLGNC